MQDLSSRIFFCYSWDDLNEVQKIANAVKHELSCDIDFYKGEENISNIEDVVYPLIDKADVFMVFISDISKDSSYVKQCSLHATHLNKRILPVLIGKNSLFSTMPEEFKFRSKPIDYKDENQRAKLFGQLKATFGISVEGGDHFGTLVHISTDVNVKVMRYGKELCVAFAGKDNGIRLTKGTHKLDFFNMGNSSENFSVSYDVKNNEGEQFLVVNFRKEIEKIAKQQEEVEKKEKQRQSILRYLGIFSVIALLGVVVYSLAHIKGSAEDVNTFDEPETLEIFEEPVLTEEEINQQVIAFITEMYNESKYNDDNFLEAHCTPRLLKKLSDEYPYDVEGIAYAGWLFRTEAQDCKYIDEEQEKNISEVISVVPQGDGWYLYEFYDGGWLGKNQVHATIKNDTIWLDDLQAVYSELDEYSEAVIEENKAAIKAFHVTDGIHFLKGTISVPCSTGGFLCEQVEIRFVQENEQITECHYYNTGVWDEHRDERLELSGIWFDNGYRFYNDDITIDLALRDFELDGHVKRNGASLGVNLRPISIEPVSSFVEEKNLIEYHGSIGPYPITMHLSYLAETGYYNYDNGNANTFTLKPVKVESEDVESNGYCHVILNEYTPKGFNSGTFDGYIDYKQGVFTGTFTNSKDKTFEFNLEIVR